MSILYKIITVAIITAFTSALLRKNHPEYAVALTITATVIIFSIMADSFSQVILKIKAMMEKSDIEVSYINAILKIMGVAYISEYSGAVLSDAGESALAKKVELAGKIIIFLLTVPILETLLTLILSML